MSKHKNDPLKYAANTIGFSTAVYFAVYYLCLIIAQLILSLIHKGATLANPIAIPEWTMGIINLVLSQGSLAAAFFALKSMYNKKSVNRISFEIPKDKKLLLYVPVFLALGILVNVITTLLSNFAATITKYSVRPAAQLPQGAVALLLYFLAICAIPAVLEELLVRGIMQNILMRWGPWFAIIVSSTVFTLLHRDITAMPSIFILSIFLGLTRWCTGSVTAGMCLHFANNTLAFLVLMCGQSTNNASMQTFTAYIMVVIIVSAFICIALIIQSKAYLSLKPIPRFKDPKNRQSRFERLATSPIFILVMITLSVRAILPLIIS